jgi:hypothetical protein
VTKAEIANAILKGTGRRPTKFLFRWEPTWKNPLHVGLLEVSKCELDGGVVTTTMPQHSRSLHLGHKVLDPRVYSVWEFLQVQLRLIV